MTWGARLPAGTTSMRTFLIGALLYASYSHVSYFNSGPEAHGIWTTMLFVIPGILLAIAQDLKELEIYG